MIDALPLYIEYVFTKLYENTYGQLRPEKRADVTRCLFIMGMPPFHAKTQSLKAQFVPPVVRSRSGVQNLPAQYCGNIRSIDLIRQPLFVKHRPELNTYLFVLHQAGVAVNRRIIVAAATSMLEAR